MSCQVMKTGVKSLSDVFLNHRREQSQQLALQVPSLCIPQPQVLHKLQQNRVRNDRALQILTGQLLRAFNTLYQY